MATKTLWGIINEDGNPESSSGNFKSKREAKGLYLLAFDKAGFTRKPAVVTSILKKEGLRDQDVPSSFVRLIDTGIAQIETVDNVGNRVDHKFTTVMIGS